MDVLTRLLGDAVYEHTSDNSFFGRNHNAVLRTESQRIIFAKQLRDVPGADARFIACKDADHLFRQLEVGSVSTPELIAEDAETRVLVYEYVDGRSLPLALRVDEYDTDLWTEMGKSLGGIHGSDGSMAPPPNASSAPGKTVVELLDALDFDSFWNLSGAEIEIWAILHSQRATLCQVSTRLDPSRRRPIHGDLRLDQFLLDRSGKLWICDWDEFNAGDPAQDLGMLCGDVFLAFLNQGIQDLGAISVENGSDGSELIRACLGSSAAKARTAITNVSGAYFASTSGAGIVDDTFYVRSGWFVVWHMIERVLARASLRAYCTAIDKAILGIAVAMAVSPGSSMKSIGLDHE
ncbi:phosphotransferase (plasmid) [Arthrobacter sp. zg-Y820]|uniref:phosphotransferase n=1 Tax=unclassified Arthrobacter TaxID=235627 RepID=UPI0025410429|nr:MULTISPECIES: phosphotransferase [unclassified Arthrobacter]MCC9198537.1 aminoglycoside phosphotransferase family protein [Arthrobacter sp. zg-Y820]MDK1281407.1 phosphotransferase [Arthrobacter sp. zg.Y820]WIB11249.1 phosphotransferase [Arthrobacter sp. zg-Y820]